jgi:hypothetical protein
MKNIPSGYKQITLILPEKVVEGLDEICKVENRKRPWQIKYWVENHVLFNASERAKRIEELQILDGRTCIDSVDSPLTEEGERAEKKDITPASNLDKALSKKPEYPKPHMVQSFMKGGK